YAAARARGQGARQARRRRAPLRLPADRAPAFRAAIGAEASRRHLLRRIADPGGRGAPRRRGRAPVGRRSRADCRAAERREERHAMTSVLLDLAIRSSVVLAAGLLIAAALRGRTA